MTNRRAFNELISVAATPANKKLIRQAAEQSGETMSQFIRRTMLSEARRILAEKGGE